MLKILLYRYRKKKKKNKKKNILFVTEIVALALQCIIFILHFS